MKIILADQHEYSKSVKLIEMLTKDENIRYESKFYPGMYVYTVYPENENYKTVKPIFDK